jgi:hypothetical protein
MTMSMAVLIAGSGPAWAQIEVCPGINTDPALQPIQGFPGYMSDATVAHCNSTYGGCFRMDGSEDMTKIIQGAIEGAGACLSYHNTGSAQSEANMLFGGGIGSLSQYQRTAFQGLAPMSRNFTSDILQNPTVVSEGWQLNQPDIEVVGLDAGVITFQPVTGGCIDLDDGIPAACATACSGAIPYGPSALAILISGYNPKFYGMGMIGTGTTAECSDPCRTCLVGYLASPSCESVSRIEHIYRPDDKSGTEAAFREKLVDYTGDPVPRYGNPVQFWCNGKSEGNNGLPGGNLKNEDLDPIRRGCVGDDSTHAYTKCTYYPLAYTCKAGDPALPANGSITVSEPTGATYNSSTHQWVQTTSSVTYTNSHNAAISCTQGLIVALSERDPGSADISTSIGNRVKTDPNGFVVGMAGLASANLISPPNVAVNINTITRDPGNIYPGAYKFGHRLFLQRNPSYADVNGICQANGGNATSAPCDTKAGRGTEENKVLAWAANDCNMAPIVTSVGFLDKWAYGCGDNCSSGAGAQEESDTITCLASGPGVGLPKQYVGAEGEACPTVSSGDGKCYPYVGDGRIYGIVGNHNQCTLDSGVLDCISGNPAGYPSTAFPASTYPKLM